MSQIHSTPLPKGGAGVGLHIMAKNISVTIKFWKQNGPKEKGHFDTHELKNIPDDTSFLEALDIMNEELIEAGKEPFVFDLELPPGFVKSGLSEAVSGGNCILELRKYPNAVTASHWYGDDYAKLDFYLPIIEKALAERFQSKVTVEKCKVDGEDAAVFTVKPVIGKNTYVYKAVVAAVDSGVYLLTARGESREFDRVLPETVWKKLLGSVEF